MRRRRNLVRTGCLLGVVSGALLTAGAVAGGPRGLAGSFAVAAGLCGGCYLFGDRVALRAVGAYPVTQVEQPRLYSVIAEVAAAARAPMPRVYLAPLATPNAFATGRSPRQASLCVTHGLLAGLTDRELRAVVAHEMAHVSHRDALVCCTAGALAAAVMVLARFAWVGALAVGGRVDDRDGGLVGQLLLLVLGPVAALLVYLAVSRHREYRADAAAAALTGDPLALASALRTLTAGNHRWPLPAGPRLVPVAAAMVASPCTGRGLLGRLFALHPPVTERLRRLEALAGPHEWPVSGSW